MIDRSISAAARLCVLVGAVILVTAPVFTRADEPVGWMVLPAYDIFEIPTTQPGDVATEGVSISPGGIVTGRILGADDARAFTWTPAGGLLELPSLNALHPFSIGYGVNDSGTVVGVGAVTYDFLFPLPLVWQSDDGAVSVDRLPFGFIKYRFARAFAVNGSGVAVGSVGVGNGQMAAIFDGRDDVIDAQSPSGADFVVAFGINDSGLIVGQGINPSDPHRNLPFVYDMTSEIADELPSLAVGAGGVAYAVSNSGHIAGTSPDEQGDEMPVIWDPARIIKAIPLPPDTRTGEARGVNSDGWAVGYAGGQYAVAFLYDGEQTHRLQDLIPKSSGWDLSQNVVASAMGISEDGVIVGTGVYRNKYRAFAMVPRRLRVGVRPGDCPASLNLMGKGLLSIAMLGSESVDVSEIDVATIRLNDVAPVRWTAGDRAFGYLPSSGQQACSADCVNGRPDGYEDLVLQFPSEALAQTLGAVVEGDCVKLRLTATLEDGVTTITEDVVVTVRSPPKSRA